MLTSYTKPYFYIILKRIQTYCTVVALTYRFVYQRKVDYWPWQRYVFAKCPSGFVLKPHLVKVALLREFVNGDKLHIAFKLYLCQVVLCFLWKVITIFVVHV